MQVLTQSTRHLGNAIDIGSGGQAGATRGVGFPEVRRQKLSKKDEGQLNCSAISANENNTSLWMDGWIGTCSAGKVCF